MNPFHWFAVVETADYFQTGSVDTWSGEVETGEQDDVIFKPPVTPAVRRPRAPAGPRLSGLGGIPRGHGRGSANLLASDELAPNPLDTAVEFRDLRFAYPSSFVAKEQEPPRR